MPSRLVAIGKQVPLDAERLGGAHQGVQPALSEPDAADALRRQVVTEHLRHLRNNPMLRLALDQQPDASEHGHPAMHTQVVADAPQVFA